MNCTGNKAAYGLILMLMVFSLMACGGGGGGSNSPSEPPAPQPQLLTGVFIDSPVGNLGYRTDTQSGMTNAEGEFVYQADEEITFFIGGLQLPATSAQPLITPLDLFSADGTAAQKVVNLIRLLQSLDTDGNPENGIAIAEVAHETATQMDFAADPMSFASHPTVLALIRNAGQEPAVSALVSYDDAVAHFNAQLVAAGRFTDSDEDGICDGIDRFPDDPSESKDTDGDGVGDSGDRYPADPDKMGSAPSILDLENTVFSANEPQEIPIHYQSEHPPASVDIMVTISQAPAGSRLLGNTCFAGDCQFTFDRLGEYTLMVEIRDGSGQTHREFPITVWNSAPHAVLYAPKCANVGMSVPLDGSFSNDLDDDALSFSWQLLTKPEASGLNDLSVTGPQIAFTPDAEGEYRIQLTVSDGLGDSDTASVTIGVSAMALQRLPYRVIDAGYCRLNDRLVNLGVDQRLYIYDTTSQVTQVVALQYPGTALSLSADGTRAVVGHDHHLSHVDLETPRVLDVYHVMADVADIIMADSGYAYVRPHTSSGNKIQIMDLSNGEETAISSYRLYGETTMALHPSGDYIYTADNDSLHKFDIRDGQFSYLNEHNAGWNSYIDNNLWMSADGARIFTAGGQVFRASEVLDEDLSYNGNLEGGGEIQSLSHLGDEVLYVNAYRADSLNYATYEVLSFRQSRPLPAIATGQGIHRTEGRFVFHTSDGSPIVIVQAEASSGLLQDYGIAYNTVGTEPQNRVPTAISGADRVVDIDTAVELSAEASFDPEGAALSYEWTLIAKPDGSSAELSTTEDPTATLIPDVKGNYQVELRVNDGTFTSWPFVMSLTAEDPADKMILPLDFRVTDAAYSTALDRIVMLSSSSMELVQFDVATETTLHLGLPGYGSVVTLSVDQMQAAVGHGPNVTIVDLVGNRIDRSYAITPSVLDLVFPDNGYVYILPGENGDPRIHALRLDTGQVETHTDYYLYGDNRAALHPSGDYIYAGENDYSSTALALFDITAGNAVHVKRGPYDRSAPVCGDIWMAEDSTGLFSRCGHVFNVNPGGDDDMTHMGRLNVATHIASLSNKGDDILVMMEAPRQHDDFVGTSEYIMAFNYLDLSYAGRIDLPKINYISGTFQTHGRHVFHGKDGQDIIAVIQTDASAGALNDYSLFIVNR